MENKWTIFYWCSLRDGYRCKFPVMFLLHSSKYCCPFILFSNWYSYFQSCSLPILVSTQQPVIFRKCNQTFLLHGLKRKPKPLRNTNFYRGSRALAWPGFFHPRWLPLTTLLLITPQPRWIPYHSSDPFPALQPWHLLFLLSDVLFPAFGVRGSLKSQHRFKGTLTNILFSS